MCREFDHIKNHVFLIKSHPPPPPVEIEGELEYEVEQILDSQLFRGKLQYLVKWVGYTEEHNTWEPAENLQHTQEAIDIFHRLHPSAPRRIRAMLPFRPIENFTDTPEGFHCILNIDDDEENSRGREC
jgi:hypothetical protein